jgi:hypothetical protein
MCTVVGVSERIARSSRTPARALAHRLPHVKLSTMISVLVTFQYGNDFDHDRVVKLATEAHAMFEGMPGLRSKAFTVDDAARCARNVYIWDDEHAGREFFSDALKKRVTGLYGVTPTVAFGEVLELVENKRGQDA